MDNGITTPRPRPSIARTPTTPPSLSNPRTLFHAVRERTRPIPNPNVIPTVGSAANSHPSHSAPSIAREKKERKRKNKSQRKQKNEAPDNLVETLFFSPASQLRSFNHVARTRSWRCVRCPTDTGHTAGDPSIYSSGVFHNARERSFVCFLFPRAPALNWPLSRSPPFPPPTERSSVPPEAERTLTNGAEKREIWEPHQTDNQRNASDCRRFPTDI